MKVKFISIIALMLLATSNVFAAKIKASEVPQEVQDAFKDRYPSAEDVEWELKDSTTYKVEFEVNKVDHEAIFKADGQWVETEIEMSKKDLPEAVTSAFKAKYSKKKIKEATRIESYQRGILYELEFRSGFKKKEAVFDSGGEFISVSKD